jgi:hypothetical protein
MYHQGSIIVCLKRLLETLAIKYREYKASRNRKAYQETRIKVLKEEAFHDLERVTVAKRFEPSAKPPPAPLGVSISEREKKSMEDENAMIQKLLHSNLEVIKQAHNKMIEISMLIRQFSVKAYEQEQITIDSNLSTP